MATIASLFGRHTPFAELQQHMRTVVDCVQHLPLMLQAIVDEDADRAKAEAKQIFALEDQADALKHSCRLHLPCRLLMPVDRRDLLRNPAISRHHCGPCRRCGGACFFSDKCHSHKRFRPLFRSPSNVWTWSPRRPRSSSCLMSFSWWGFPGTRREASGTNGRRD